MINKFNKILIANRGEIAIRIIRTAKSMGIKTVALYINGEENSPHVTKADEAVSLGKGSLDETYLNIGKIVDIAYQTGAQAIHPGYGFQSENPEFAKACNEKGIVFIGPSVEVLEKMGNKLIAKSIAQKTGVNVLLSHKVDLINIENQASQFNYPIMIKASHGGGGKGMQVVYSSDELIEKAKTASRSAQNYFGNGEIYLEDFIQNARHIEVQVLGDQYGNIIHLYERDCTLQRNHQKIIEEAPAPSVSTQLRTKLLNAAISICNEVGFENAGTVEFLVDENEQNYFLEMNPRIQVEHTVTEQVTGVDIVKEQLLVAAGNPLSFKQEEVRVVGHAIEVRIYAEDPQADFIPSGKSVQYFSFPCNDAIRIETSIDSRSKGAVQFDPLLCKLIATGVDREHAKSKLINALDDTFIVGPKTNQLYLQELIKTSLYAENRLTTNFCEKQHKSLINKITLANEKFDRRFLIAASLVSLYNLKPVKSISVWDSIGYWRLHSIVELFIGDASINIWFKRKENGLFIKYNNESFFAEVVPISDAKIEIKIDNINKSCFVFKENEAKIQLAYKGIYFEISTNDILDYFPEDYMIDSDFDYKDINTVKSHLHGKIVALNIEKNQTINKGDVLLVIESMKSENLVISPKKAKVKKITVELGTQVTDQMPMVYLEDL